ncbi:MAG: hypothetical protein ACE5FU_13075, partial [Nitrospinota bacterium]
MKKALVLIFVLSCGVFKNSASGAETHGRVTVNNVLYSESSEAPDYNISTVRLRLTTKKDALSKTAFHFDSRFRVRTGERALHSDIPKLRITSLFLQAEEVTERIGIDAGRFAVSGARGVWVDGMHVQYRLNGAKVSGAFVGTEPDPYKDGLNTDFTTFGGYFSREKKQAGIGIASVNSFFKGKQDRTFLDIHGFLNPTSKTNLSHTSTVDYDQSRKRARLTNFSLNLTTRVFSSLRIRLSFNRYEAVKRQKSMNYDPFPGHEARYSINLFYRGIRNYFIYSRADFRHRSFDKRDSLLYSLGVRRREFFFSGLEASLRFSYHDHFSSKLLSGGVELRREFFEKLDISGSVTAREESSTFLNTEQNVLVYFAGADMMVSRNFFFSTNI